MTSCRETQNRAGRCTKRRRALIVEQMFYNVKGNGRFSLRARRRPGADQSRRRSDRGRPAVVRFAWGVARAQHQVGAYGVCSRLARPRGPLSSRARAQALTGPPRGMTSPPAAARHDGRRPSADGQPPICSPALSPYRLASVPKRRAGAARQNRRLVHFGNFCTYHTPSKT